MKKRLKVASRLAHWQYSDSKISPQQLLALKGGNFPWIDEPSNLQETTAVGIEAEPNG